MELLSAQNSYCVAFLSPSPPSPGGEVTPHLGWELHDEDVLEDTPVYVVVLQEQALETVGEGGHHLTLAHPEAE